MFREFFVKRKVKKFIVSMSQTLATDYGRPSGYTEGQVKTALIKLGYDSDFEEIAIAIFCNDEVAKACGMDQALIKRYRGYSRDHNIGFGSDGGGFGGDAGGSD